MQPWRRVGGSRGIATFIINVGSRYVCSRLHAPAALSLGRDPGTLGWWVGLEVVKMNKISCPYWKSNSGSCSPKPSHYTDCTVRAVLHARKFYECFRPPVVMIEIYSNSVYQACTVSPFPGPVGYRWRS
jgi:hypothetical protein